MRRLTFLAVLLAASALAAGAGAQAPAANQLTDVAWSPDGTQLAVGDTSRLVLMNADGSGKRVLATARDGFDQVEWGPAGRIVFASDFELWRVDPRTGAVHLIGIGSDPALSPDGRRVAFDNDGAGSCTGFCGGLYVGVANISGGGLRHLPMLDRSGHAIDAEDGQPSFFPDGTRIVFVRQSRVGARGLGRPSIVAEPATGGRVTPIGAVGNAPRVSPNGRWIAYTDARGLEVVPAAGGARRLLLRVPGSRIEATWSPDSTRLAAGYPGHLAVVGLTGGVRSIAAPFTGDYDQPKWSPDGTTLAFIGGPPGARVAYTVSADGSGLRVVDSES
jgi:Tol biopolymer transport system component